MTLSHHHSWIRRLVPGVFLVAAAMVPLKVVFACTMMDRVVELEQCCCDQERCEGSVASCKGSVTSENVTADDRCCAVTFGANEDGSLATAKSVAKQPIKKLWDRSPDLAMAPPAVLATIEFPSTSQSIFLPELHFLDGSRLYLLTARLRL